MQAFAAYILSKIIEHGLQSEKLKAQPTVKSSLQQKFTNFAYQAT